MASVSPRMPGVSNEYLLILQRDKLTAFIFSEFCRGNKLGSRVGGLNSPHRLD